MNHPFLISVVDDDSSVRESLESLLKSLGFRVETFSGAEKFLESRRASVTDCLILDVSLDGMSGPELQQHLKKVKDTVPIVFITAHGSDALRARVVAEGAIDCLLKPFSEEGLLSAVKRALSLPPEPLPAA